MDIQFFGANCVRIANKKATLVFDDNLSELGAKSVTKSGDVALFTGVHEPVSAEVRLSIDFPGEYEVADISVRGVQARAHIDEEGKRTAVMYRLMMDDIRVAVVGHVHPDLTEAQLELLGVIDVLIIPVGGNGYTLDSIGALKLIKKIEPKIVIPTHYDDKDLKFEVPQQALTDALTGLSMEVSETVERLKLKSTDIDETTKLIVVERSK
ncbi:MBL fold metallo-hydrolase [Candidatus Saccharibacteria bacterium]|nr:MBL fold metallo-hydrolase [Candidatus Saccharibacteria bacterium]